MPRKDWSGKEIRTFEMDIPVRIYDEDYGIPNNTKPTMWESVVRIKIDASSANEAVAILQKRLGDPICDCKISSRVVSFV